LPVLQPERRISAIVRPFNSAWRCGEVGGNPHHRRAVSSRNRKCRVSQLSTAVSLVPPIQIAVPAGRAASKIAFIMSVPHSLGAGSRAAAFTKLTWIVRSASLWSLSKLGRGSVCRLVIYRRTQPGCGVCHVPVCESPAVPAGGSDCGLSSVPLPVAA
jgi:hypothetical protein